MNMPQDVERMEFNIAFMGAAASGKTAAIRAISEIEVLDTDQRTAAGSGEQSVFTTVALDFGVMSLASGERLRLYGTPGQKRFDFMWDIVVQRCVGVALVINHAARNPLADLDLYLKEVRARSGNRVIPVVVCISHVDQNPSLPLSIYGDYLRKTRGTGGGHVPPVVTMDARESSQVRSALIAMAALLEMRQRFERDPRGRATGAALALEH